MLKVSPECVTAVNGYWTMLVDNQEPVLFVGILPGLAGKFIREGEEDSHIKTNRRIGVFVLRSVIPVDQAPASLVQAQGVWWTLAGAPLVAESISRARLALGWIDESKPQLTEGIRHEA